MRITACRACEPWAPAQEILDRIIENYNIADEREVAICQDTGLACVFLEIGQDVHISGDLRTAVDEGVRRNKGRTGAAAAPAAIRKALAGLAWHRSAPAYDAGDRLQRL